MKTGECPKALYRYDIGYIDIVFWGGNSFWFKKKATVVIRGSLYEFVKTVIADKITRLHCMAKRCIWEYSERMT